MTFTQRLCAALRRCARNRNLLDADEILPVRLFGDRMMSSRRAFGDDLAAMDAGARPHIDHMIGGADGFFVMLDDDARCCRDRAGL